MHPVGLSYHWKLVPITSHLGAMISSCANTYNGGQVEMEHLVISDTLLSNLTWSDAHPITSDDMLYSFNLLADTATPGNKYAIERTF